MMNKKEMIKQNNSIGDDADVVNSLANLAINSLTDIIQSNADNATSVYHIMNLLKVIAEKSMIIERGSSDLGATLDNLTENITGVRIHGRTKAN
ncbi:hypothetical protein M3M39_06360 [Fructilactobacillus hinvesii]|uniref:Uncharacterized protein n=1 Tax=Fructilactobacillus hinvesii TaxID=2940300 RepID=A0ABY5BSU6_9LACO|nr:hypothetical protein [Fructilactobacillus hinvesii]USS87725.1 hypothetical protein M3M39_06360 [Fructilactobacillus hinvesii]